MVRRAAEARTNRYISVRGKRGTGERGNGGTGNGQGCRTGVSEGFPALAASHCKPGIWPRQNDPTHRVTPHLPTGLVGFKTTTLFFYVPATFSWFLFSEMVADAGRVRLRSLLFFPTRPIVTHPTSPRRPPAPPATNTQHGFCNSGGPLIFIFSLGAGAGPHARHVPI